MTPDQAFEQFRADLVGHLSQRLDVPPEAVRVWLRDYLLEPPGVVEPPSTGGPPPGVLKA